MGARLRRLRWLCGWLAAVLLYGQVAAVAYACPAPKFAASAAVSAEAAAERAPTADSVGMPACAGHGASTTDAGDPLWCKAHCQADDQSVNSAPAATDVPSALFVALVRVLDVAHAEALAATIPAARTPGPPPGAPPIYLSLLALRQ